MDIGFDAKRLFFNNTGLGNYSRSVVKNLLRYFPDSNYHLFTPSVPRNERTDFFLSNHQFRIHKSGLMPDSIWRSFLMAQQAQSRGIDIFHGLSNELPFVLPQKKTRYVVTIHDLIFRKLPDTYRLADRLIYDKKFRYACNAADKVIAISQSTKADIIEMYGVKPNKIDVLYQSCNPLYYSNPAESTCHTTINRYKLPNEYMIMVGSVEYRKNLHSVLKALSLVPLSESIPLVVVGRGKEYRKNCIQLATSLKIQDRIIWLDFIDTDTELQCLIHKAVCMVYPSLYEGFGLPVAEALLMGTPVITSQTSSLPEAGGPGALYVDPLNIEDIADALKRIIADISFRERLANEGYNYVVDKFDPEKLTSQLMNIYEALI